MNLIFTVLVVLTPFAAYILWRRPSNRSVDQKEFIDQYQVLLNLITHRRTSQILKAKAGFLSVKISMNADEHLFTLQELDERLMVSWRLKSREFGNTSRDWSFKPNYSQNKMYEEVLTDIKTFQLKQIRERRNQDAAKVRLA